MKLRITSGYLKGRFIISPKGDQTRPTSERLRQTVFDILSNRIEDARFLDLYAGSGAIAFEAISRGASHAVLIEKAPLASKSISEAIQQLNISDKVELMRQDCEVAISKLKGGEPFDLGYIDPPYPKSGAQEAKIQKLLKLIADTSIFRSGALILLELADTHLDIKSWLPEQFKLLRSRKILSSSLHEIEVE